MQRLDAAATLSEVMERRPALRALLEACSPLMELRSSLPGILAERVMACGFRLPEWDEARGAEGEPLLERADMAALVQPLREAGLAFVPGLSGLHGLSGQLSSLEAFFRQDDAKLALALRAFLSSDAETLASQGAGFALSLSVLAFVLELALGAVIRAAVLLKYPSAVCSQYGPDDKPAPWDARPASWTRGWCPVCGGSPAMAYLEERSLTRRMLSPPAEVAASISIAASAVRSGISGGEPVPLAAGRRMTLWRFCARKKAHAENVWNGADIVRAIFPSSICGSAVRGLIWMRWLWG